MTQITIDPVLRTAVFTLYQQSPDYLTDLGVLMHVLCWRRFNRGPGRWWADVPVQDIAKRSHMGFKRVAESLARLEEMGFIVPANGNERAAMSRNPRRYKLMNGTPSWTKYVREKHVKSLEERQQTLQETPSDHMDYKVFMDGKIAIMTAPRALVIDYPICPMCDERYEPTQGAAPDGSELCVECWIQEQLATGKQEVVVYGKEYRFV